MTPRTVACQASLSFTISQSLLRLMSIESVMLSISPSSMALFFCLQSFPASESFPVSQLFASGGQSFGAIGILQILYLSGWRSTKRFSNLIFSLPKMNTLRSAFDGFWSLSSSGLVASSYESSLSVITPQCQVHRWVYTQIFRDSSCFLWFIWGIWETSGGAESPWWFCFSFSMCLTLAAVWQDSRIGGHWCFKLWQLPVSLPLTGLNPLC